MDFIVSHPDPGIDVILYAVDHAEEIPMRAETTPVQIRQHRTYVNHPTHYFGNGWGLK